MIVDSQQFWRIMTGKKKNFHLLVKNVALAKKIFKYDGDHICVNPVFRFLKESWDYHDINGGNCPFLLRDFACVHFVCEETQQTLAMKIEGIPSINLKYGFWDYSFRVGDIIHLSI